MASEASSLSSGVALVNIGPAGSRPGEEEGKKGGRKEARKHVSAERLRTSDINT